MTETKFKIELPAGLLSTLRLPPIKAALDQLIMLKGYREAPSAKDWSEDRFGASAWRNCTPASLRGHIANAHFHARTLANIGIARHDIEIAVHRRIRLEWVAKKAYEKLERTDNDIERELFEHGVPQDFGVAEYRAMLVKNLKFIERMGSAVIDWNRVEASFPGARDVQINMETDSTDMSFLEHVVPFLRQ